jgi:hypothetical protein
MLRKFWSDFLERHIKIKSYQPFWCWNFLITHEFGQIFSSVALKVCCSLKSSGYQAEKSSLWHKYPNFGFFKKKTEIKTILNAKNMKSPLCSKSWKIFSADCWVFSQHFQASWSWYSTDCWVLTQLISFWWYCFTNLAQVASTPLLIWHRWQQSNPEGSGITTNLSGYLRAWCIWSWKMRIVDRSFQSFHPF